MELCSQIFWSQKKTILVWNWLPDAWFILLVFSLLIKVVLHRDRGLESVDGVGVSVKIRHNSPTNTVQVLRLTTVICYRICQSSALITRTLNCLTCRPNLLLVESARGKLSAINSRSHLLLSVKPETGELCDCLLYNINIEV